jgi:hypothetical protein
MIQPCRSRSSARVLVISSATSPSGPGISASSGVLRYALQNIRSPGSSTAAAISSARGPRASRSPRPGSGSADLGLHGLSPNWLMARAWVDQIRPLRVPRVCGVGVRPGSDGRMPGVG